MALGIIPPDSEAATGGERVGGMGGGQAPEQKPRPSKSPWLFVGTSLQMGVAIGAGVAGGWWLDQRFGWAPWGVLAGGILGAVVGIYLILKEAS